MGRKPSRNLNLPTGMRARHRPSGTYYYLDTGKTPRREIPLGSDYPLAMKKWAELTLDNQCAYQEHITFRYVAERYQREELPKKAPRTQKDNLQELAKLYEFFDNPPATLNDIEPHHISAYLDWRVQDTIKRFKAKGKPIKGNEGQVRANREKALFSHIWNFARRKGFTKVSNPCTGISNFKETGRDIYIEDELYQLVRQAADEPLRDAMDLAYLTGQRPADVLKFDEGHIKEGAIWITQNKRGKKLRITIEGELTKVIERIHTRKRGYEIVSTALIVNEDGQPLTSDALRSRFDKAREIAGIKKEDFQFRDLRAKAGTDKEEHAGMAATKDQLGHADEKMTQRYVRHRKGKLVTPTK